MKDKIIAVLMTLGLSMFCGIVAISIGFGSVMPSVHQLAAPLVCGDRKLVIEQDTYRYIPGEQTTAITAYCVDAGGAKEEVNRNLENVTFTLQMATGLIFGLIVFVLALIFLNWAAWRLGKSFEELFQPGVRGTKQERMS